jgi:Nif-specific regulatory protein
MHAAVRDVRARSANVAIHGVYEVSKLLASGTEHRARKPEILGIICNFFELSDAVIALAEGVDGPRLVRPHRSHGQSPYIEAFAAEALRRAAVCPMPWIVESSSDDAGFQSACPDAEEDDVERSYVAVPVRDHPAFLGVLCIERVHSPGDQAEFCFDSDVRLLTLIANVIAAVERGHRPRDVVEQAPAKIAALPPQGEASREPHGMLGEHPRWQASLSRARASARCCTTVLLRGESGAGKEVLASYIHRSSPRADKPYVTLNCAALSESLLESELFGHEKGAFTGALARRKGRFEQADGGTLFLDEIGEISAAFQARLLRVLQLGEFERVGGTSTLKVDVRLIAATNRNLEEDVQTGRFRADLYYRISVIPIYVPALRERGSDIALLAQEFVRRFNAQNGSTLRLDASALAALCAYRFPGNVRELENAVCRAATLADREVLSAQDFDWLSECVVITPKAPREEMEAELAALPRDRLVAAMERSGWVQAKAARMLGLSARQIGYALHKYGIPLRRL